MNEATVNSAMQIILHAGDARLACMQALDAIAVADLEKAKEKLKEAQVKITEAHRIQTDVIQEEMRIAMDEECEDKPSEYSLLFAHAQDTLMTIYSEINIAKHLMKIYTAYEKRIAALEEKIEGFQQ